MIFTETALPGAFIVEPELIKDERGFFTRLWSEEEFAEHGLETRLVQCNASFNIKKGTLRGMHFQMAPYAQAKLVSCLRGSVYDVIIDLRRESPTFKKWVGVQLSASNRLMLYVPKGLAHGFQTLEDETEVFYQMSEVYSVEHVAGVRWNDPAFAIQWPADERTIIHRDATYPDFSETAASLAAE
ncbi:MAG TPA: dTDP-4-dehydrorhamnose 3,5-epimerase [Pyrinomonadaceae bacterium]|nr:dTDP-4-dehydrorhamnose 3,5-epimerase [Pyrinomonadaceae bacterium]